MNYKKMKKVSALLLISATCVGLFSSCEKKEHDWRVYLPSTIVANGDYLTTSIYGNSDYEFEVNYYWDGSLIQTTDKEAGLNFLVTTQEAGDHTLKTEFTGEAKGSAEYLIQVYNKEEGFLGCELIPNNRIVKNGEDLQGNVVFIPATSKQWWTGEVSEIRAYIDPEKEYGNDKDKALQIKSNAPFNFKIPIKGLAKGEHQLVVEVDGVRIPTIAVIGAGGGMVSEGRPGSASYQLTVIE